MGGRKRMRVSTPEAPVVDTTPRGSINIWPMQCQEPDLLAEEVARGDHDAHLSDLRAAEKTQRDDHAVMAAIDERLKAARG